MPDVEQVLRALDCVRHYTKPSVETCKNCPYWFRAGYELFCDMPAIIADAITLIEDAHEDHPIAPVVFCGDYECAERRYELRKDADSYCPCCGRKVDWDAITDDY